MEYLIGVLLIVALYMVLPGWKGLKQLNDEQKLDGGYFGKKPKALKKRTRKKTARVRKPIKKVTTKRKTVKRKTTRKPKK